MQNSNLSAKIFPNIREDWLLFIEKISNDLQEMITTYNNDKRRIKDLERIIHKMEEIKEISKDKIEEILNYKELFMYIDNSLESSFDALKFFKEQNNFDNPGVKTIYERIVNSPKIIQLNSEYSRLIIKVPFDKERIKKLGELIRGSKIDYALIKELINKYKLSDEQKKNIMFYPVVMLSIKQNDIKNPKENAAKQKEEEEKFYHERFNELSKLFQDIKEKQKELLVRCFNVREKMDPRDVDTYISLANNPDEVSDYDFDDDIKFKIYTLSLFKIKKDIEKFIDGISDLLTDGRDLDDELAFFKEMIDEFNDVASKLKSLIKSNDEKGEDEMESNVFFALDAFNRLLIKEELLTAKNRSNIKALIEKANSANSSKIEGMKTNPMLGVEEAEKLLDKDISILVTSKLMIAYVMIDRNVLIIAGDANNNDKFSKMVNRIVERNIVPLKKQIALIKDNDLDYIDLQNRILKIIMGEEEQRKAM